MMNLSSSRPGRAIGALCFFAGAFIGLRGAPTTAVPAAPPDPIEGQWAGTLSSGALGGVPTTVLVAGDDGAAKARFAEVFGTAVAVMDAGSLRRAHELEAVGFLQMTLAAAEKIGWTGGFATVR